MNDILFPAKNAFAYRSYRAGYDFGKLYYSSNSALTNGQLSRLVMSLRPCRTTFDVDTYRIGFELGYRIQVQENGNRLPENSRFIQERSETIMGKLKQAQQATAIDNGFMKAERLAEMCIPFCIRSIEITSGRFGRQWLLNILVNPIDLDRFDTTENIPCKLTFTMNDEKPNSRDRTLQALLKECPVHNASVIAIPSSSGNSYHDLQEINLPMCICGTDTSEEEETGAARF